MSADNGIILNLKTFKVTYFMGDGMIDSHKCNSLKEAILKCQELGETEYGISLKGKLKTPYISAGGADFVEYEFIKKEKK